MLMLTYEIIAKNFSYDEPILIEDIEKLFPNKSRPWIDKAIRTLVDEKKIKRYSTGIYYIPRKTLFGDSILSANKVIEKKYLSNDDDVYGYVTGVSLLNSLGLTTQVPNSISIVTNNESSRGRRITIGKQDLYLIKAPTKITKKNYAVLQLLEAIKLIDLNDLDETENNNLIRYITNNSITLKEISEYCNYFPDFVSKKILGGNLIGLFTQ